MNAFLQGILLGFSAAIPLGPINIMIMTSALISYLKAVAIGLGAMSADIAYLLLLSFGLVKHLQNEMVLRLIGIFGICYLLFIAFLIFKGRNSLPSVDKTENFSRVEFAKSYLKGLFATLSNPYTIGFWLSVASMANSFHNPHIMIAGLILAITLWISLMPLVVFKTSKILPQNFIFYTSIASSLVLVCFAILLFYKIFISNSALAWL